MTVLFRGPKLKTMTLFKIYVCTLQAFKIELAENHYTYYECWTVNLQHLQIYRSRHENIQGKIMVWINIIKQVRQVTLVNTRDSDSLLGEVLCLINLLNHCHSDVRMQTFEPALINRKCVVRRQPLLPVVITAPAEEEVNKHMTFIQELMLMFSAKLEVINDFF